MMNHRLAQGLVRLVEQGRKHADRILRRASGSLSPMRSETVAIKSVRQVSSAAWLAGLILPGQRAMKGMRWPPSQDIDFVSPR